LNKKKRRILWGNSRVDQKKAGDQAWIAENIATITTKALNAEM